MKTFPTLLFLAWSFLASVAPGQVLQNFSNVVGPDTFFHGSWEATGITDGTVAPNPNFMQGAGVYAITGTSGPVPTNDALSKIELFFGTAAPFSIGTNTLLSISAQGLATNVATSFVVTLVGSNSLTAFATFSTAAFPTGSYSTVTGALTFNGGFDPTQIDSLRISGGQPGGTDRFNISFDNISAVAAIPEPATSAALLAVGALGFVVWRRARPRSTRAKRAS